MQPDLMQALLQDLAEQNKKHRGFERLLQLTRKQIDLLEQLKEMHEKSER